MHNLEWHYSDFLRKIKEDPAYQDKGRQAYIHQDAYVSSEARLGVGVVVMENSIVSANAQLGTRVVIGPDCYVGEGVSIGMHSVMHGCASVAPFADIGSFCKIQGHASVGHGAHVGSGCDLGYNSDICERGNLVEGSSTGAGAYLSRTYPVHAIKLFAHTDKYPLTVFSDGFVSIGCKSLLIDEWLDNYRSIGLRQDMSEELITRYYRSLLAAKAWVESFNVEKTATR